MFLALLEEFLCKGGWLPLYYWKLEGELFAGLCSCNDNVLSFSPTRLKELQLFSIMSQIVRLNLSFLVGCLYAGSPLCGSSSKLAGRDMADPRIVPRLPSSKLFFWFSKRSRESVESYRQTKTTTIDHEVTSFLEIRTVASVSGQACMQVRIRKSAGQRLERPPPPSKWDPNHKNPPTEVNLVKKTRRMRCRL
jgi:hypothetical protein